MPNPNGDNEHDLSGDSCAEGRQLTSLHLRGYVLDAADHEQGVTPDEPDLGLAVLIGSQVGDICGHDAVIAAARFEFNELH
jgi:hypothetical protein